MNLLLHVSCSPVCSSPLFSNKVRAPSWEVTSSEGRTRPRGHERSRVQRIKRGWVWNQFFVLEEYMGSEPQYVGKVRMFLYEGILKWCRTPGGKKGTIC
uniref:Uncharacterized protein n=1 Tax=Labrus bergylta TaxID=56723 RepID=A0A3Q3FSU8_9LABR